MDHRRHAEAGRFGEHLDGYLERPRLCSRGHDTTGSARRDAPIDYEVVRRARYAKVVVRGKWWPDLFPGREEGGAALRAVAAEVAVLIDADLREFDRSAHNPEIEQPDQFNDLLRQTWRNRGSERIDSMS
jgi:pimeloyl-ACP methyl ester carboxylesterase